MIEPFLVGVIATTSATAGLFFVRFWRDTRDSFFLAFAASFMVEGLNRMAVLFLPRPNEGNPWIYLVRLLASLLILFAILRKNYGRSG
jgi:uncharacterized membrane protein HdeD (DUF308 family)